MTQGLDGFLGPKVRDTFEVSTDLSGNEHLLVNWDSSDQLQLAGAGAKAVVLVEPKDTAGQEATVQLFGQIAVKAGGSINTGDPLTPDSNGKAVTASGATVDTTTSNSSEDVSGDKVFGVALEDGDSDDLVTAFVFSSQAITT